MTYHLAPPPIKILDPGGDVKLSVGFATRMVSSTAIRLAGPKWQALEVRPLPVSGHLFYASKLEVPESIASDITTVDFILSIIHLRFAELPEEITFEQLFHLAVLCSEERYDCAHLVKPFLPKWAKPWIPFVRAQGYEGWLLISWVFGYKSLFEDVTERLAVVSELGTGAQLHTTDRLQKLKDTDMVPLFLIGKVPHDFSDRQKPSEELTFFLVPQKTSIEYASNSFPKLYQFVA